ncbi:MAG: class I SAM-dependent methyltransferase [Arenicella sp.]
MDLPLNDALIPPGDLAIENKIGASINPEAAQNEWKEYGRLQMKDWVARQLITPSSNVLDVGCGLGRVAHTLAGWLNEGSYTGIDITESSIDWCAEHYSDYANFRFIHADLSNSHYNRPNAQDAGTYEFPIEPASMDFIWSTSLFTHMRIHQVDNYLGQMARAAKPGSIIWNTFFILDEFSEPLARAGIPGWGVMPHSIESGLYMTEGNPDHVIAFYLDKLLELHEKHGFDIVNVGFGGWSGRAGTNDNGQDTIVAQKR